ncbi:hypothetical protein QL285_020896 [Trifolium repens]|nr:hypothetical protein QL285_020896 [Trifolium repens]
MTKTDPNTKENLQNPRKASRQSREYKKTRKAKKSEENVLIIGARWLPSCHDGSCLLAKKTKEINLKNICSSCYDAPYRGMMTLLGDQADEMHKISYKIELNLPIVLRWTYRSAMDGLLRPITKTINRAPIPHYYSFKKSRTLSNIRRCSEEL